eukprot:TRINITY_DN51840_c0_g1_i1.p1 TRINITY_DN51840_c0_g1~~TRINITY_DN51840_c0_g1_i1.p1  ORF type:complete len:192 (-),score=12.78 TRINITY_DN51840_c0_g1_i1:42-572(-)
METMKKNEGKFSEIESPDEVADLLGQSAIFIQDMAAARIKNYDFDWTRMTSIVGDTGPYLQYAHARLSSIIRKTSEVTKLRGDVDFSLLVEPEALNLAALIAQWPEIVQTAAKTSEPCAIVQYLLKLSHEISTAYRLKVLGQEEKTAEARLLLFWSAKIVLHNGLLFLGLTPLNRM